MDRIRLIASDMDATLLDKNSQLPPDFERTVKALAEMGIHFAAANQATIEALSGYSSKFGASSATIYFDL